MRNLLVGIPTLGLLAAAGFIGCVGDEPADTQDERLADDSLIEAASQAAASEALDLSALHSEQDDLSASLDDAAHRRALKSAASVDTGAFSAAPSPGGLEWVPTAGCGNLGAADFCNSTTCKCVNGEGDCDSDAECVTGTLCAQDVGTTFGFDPVTDVCITVDSCSNTIPGRSGFCSVSCKCTAGEGDCNSDSECDTGHQCAVDVGASYGYGALADVCVAVDSCSGTIPGRATMCSNSCPCEATEGDCDADNECGTGLTCVADVGATYDMGPLVDVCLAPWINEIHYDNLGTDTGEGVEIAGPAGLALTGWSIVLYNGSTGATYNTIALSGTIPNQLNGYGTVWSGLPTNGVQNGSPDGVALDGPNGVVHFLSYEGAFTATNGPANGVLSTDLGVAETGTVAAQSLQLTGTGSTYSDFTWAPEATATPGAINNNQTF